MQNLQIKAKANPLNAKGEVRPSWVGEPTAREGEFTVKVGSTLEECAELFGAEVVMNKFLAAVVVDAQTIVRTRLEKNISATDIQAALDAWKPGVKAPAVAKVVSLSDMTVDQIAALDLSTLSEGQIAAIRKNLAAAGKK